MEKIEKLKKIFKREKIDGYIISKNDEYFGEYVPDHNDRLNFISNFSGSNGFAIISEKYKAFFTDGRYLTQAKYELDAEFEIYNLAEIAPHKWLAKHLPDNWKRYSKSIF